MWGHEYTGNKNTLFIGETFIKNFGIWEMGAIVGGGGVGILGSWEMGA